MQRKTHGCIEIAMTSITLYREALLKAIEEITLPDGRILITGASGLMGSCLIDMLMLANSVGRNFEIYAHGRNMSKMQERFKNFVGNTNLHFIEQDICTPLDNNMFFDYIIHGASNADPVKYALFPVETMTTNINGTLNVLNYCKAHKETRMLFLSTFEVYGNRGFDEYNEDQFGIIDVNSIRSSYPESKRSAEILIRCYIEEYGINALIARLCSVYGPTMSKDDSKAHSQFIRNALKHENIVLKSKGEQRRTYCYVIDAVTGLLYILAKGANSEVYNVSYENSIATIAEVAHTVADIVGSKVIFDLPNEVERRGFSNPQNCILVNGKLRNLGWKGKYSLKEGMKATITILNDFYIDN